MHILTCTFVQLPKWLLRVKEEKGGKEEGKQERGEKGCESEGWMILLFRGGKKKNAASCCIFFFRLKIPALM